MRRDLVASIVAVVVFTAFFGIAYPLAMTGTGQLAFPGAADGSLVERDGDLVGSRLIGQEFLRKAVDADGEVRRRPNGRPIFEADPRYFQSRPSVTGYDPAGTFFNNLGPNNAELRDLFRENLDTYLSLEGRYDPGLQAEDVPADAVQTSASGVDPHISPMNAAIQAHRIAAVRDATHEQIATLIDEHTDDRSLGVLGEPGVNVLELNLALDQELPLDGPRS